MPSAWWLPAAQFVWSWTENHLTAREWIVKAFRRPQLFLDEDSSRPREAILIGRDGMPGAVLMVRLRNVGRSTATGCRVYVKDVVLEGQSAYESESGSSDLSWADGDVTAKNLLPGASTYVNVCRVSEGNKVLTLSTRRGEGGGDKWWHSGQYDVTIRAEAGSFVSPVEIAVRIHHSLRKPLDVRMEVLAAATVF